MLLDESVQLQLPLWPEFPRGWWYVDLVDISEDGDRLMVQDWWIDRVVPPDGPYRILDVHEYADALRKGPLTVEQAAVGLERVQAFVDGHLHRSPDFPPAALAPLLATGWGASDLSR